MAVNPNKDTDYRAAQSLAMDGLCRTAPSARRLNR